MPCTAGSADRFNSGRFRSYRALRRRRYHALEPPRCWATIATYRALSATTAFISTCGSRARWTAFTLKLSSRLLRQQHLADDVATTWPAALASKTAPVEIAIKPRSV